MKVWDRSGIEPEPLNKSVIVFFNNIMQNMILLCANNKGADQTAHPLSLFSPFDIRLLKIIFTFKISTLQLIS